MFQRRKMASINNDQENEVGSILLYKKLGVLLTDLGVAGQEGLYSRSGSCCASRGERILGGEWKGEEPRLRAPITGLLPKHEKLLVFTITSLKKSIYYFCTSWKKKLFKIIKLCLNQMKPNP